MSSLLVRGLLYATKRHYPKKTFLVMGLIIMYKEALLLRQEVLLYWYESLNDLDERRTSSCLKGRS